MTFPPPVDTSSDPFAFASQDARGTTRLEAFVDGIFATAATLLIFSISFPEPVDDSAEALISALWAQWPIYLGLLLSYILIGATWANHHRIFRYIERISTPLLILNVLMMLSVICAPFATNLLTTMIANPAQARVATAIYGGLWSVGGLFYMLMWRHAVRARLLDPAMPPEAIRIVTRHSWIGLFIYLLGFAASFIHAYLALAIFATVGMGFILPERVSKPRKAR